MRPQTVIRQVLLTLFFGLVGFVSAATNDLSGSTDDSIRNVINLVASRQMGLHTNLTDGNYTTAYTTNAAKSATKPIGIQWEYTWGVALYGMLQAGLAVGNTNAENYALNHNAICARYYAWLKSLQTTVTNASSGWLASYYSSVSFSDMGNFARLGSSGFQGKLDYCGSMTASLLEGALKHKGGLTAEQVVTGSHCSDYVSAGQSRLPNGTLWRPERYSGTIWADDLYMSCPFLIRWYLHTGDTNYLNDAATQVINMAGYLQDTNGLWYHGVYVTNYSVNGIKWGRANGWALVTTAEILSVMPTNYPTYTNLLGILQRHVEGLKSVQQSSGRWRQILDNNSTTNWEETSCSAMFAYGIARAVNRGWIDLTNMAVARAAFVGVAGKIQTNGFVSGVCPGTHIERSLSYYLVDLLPTATFEDHGPGPVMLAGSEILLTNRPPLVVDRRASVAQNQSMVLYTGKLLATASDAEGNTLSVTAAGSISTNNGTVVLGTNSITYTPATNYTGADRFSYVVGDGHGNAVPANVMVTVTSSNAASLNIVSQPQVLTNGHYYVAFVGIPGYKYTIQYASTASGSWTTSTNVTADAKGLFKFEDFTTPTPPARFYRVVYP